MSDERMYPGDRVRMSLSAFTGLRRAKVFGSDELYHLIRGGEVVGLEGAQVKVRVGVTEPRTGLPVAGYRDIIVWAGYLTKIT